MIISELIKQLEALKNESGDLEILVQDLGGNGLSLAPDGVGIGYDFKPEETIFDTHEQVAVVQIDSRFDRKTVYSNNNVGYLFDVAGKKTRVAIKVNEDKSLEVTPVDE